MGRLILLMGIRYSNPKPTPIVRDHLCDREVSTALFLPVSKSGV